MCTDADAGLLGFFISCKVTCSTALMAILAANGARGTDGNDSVIDVDAVAVVELAPDRGRCRGRVVGDRTGLLLHMPVFCMQHE